MGRPWTCTDCGATGVQEGRGGARRRCDRCRAGKGGNTPRKRDAWTAEPLAAPVRVVLSPGRYGSVTEAVTADLDALMTPHPMAEGLRAVALSLAAQLDVAEPRFAGGLARELRATLDGLASYPSTSDGPADEEIDLGAEYGR
jgi:hypothetical protein